MEKNGLFSQRIRLRHLHTFVAVAQQGTLGRAAETLNLSQPALSKTLNELEQLTGARLFDRGRLGAQLTIVGEQFLTHAVKVLDALNTAGQSLHRKEELMGGLNYELLFLESLKLVVRPDHPLLQDTVTLSRVMEWPVVVCPKGTVPRQTAETLLQMQGCTLPSGCIETLSASLSRQLTLDYDYVWFVPSGAVKDDLRQGTLIALPITSPGPGEPIGILTRVDTPLSTGAQTLLSAIRKSMPV